MDKRGLEFETLAKWIIALLVLTIVIIGTMLLRERGSDIINKFLDFLRFGRP